MLSETYDEFLRFPDENTSGNFADIYTVKDGYVCCGPMDAHNDDGYECGVHQPYYWIVAKYWDPKYAFVHTVANGDLEIVHRTDEEIRFMAIYNHAFLPIDVAEACVEANTFECEANYNWENSIDLDNQEIALVWVWTNDEHLKGKISDLC